MATEKTKQNEVNRWESVKNTVERRGHMLATEKIKQKEADRWEAAKKQSRKKWTDRRQLRNKVRVERSEYMYCGS